MANNSPKPEENPKGGTGRKAMWLIPVAAVLAVILIAVLAVGTRQAPSEANPEQQSAETLFGESADSATEASAEAEASAETSVQQPQEEYDPGLPLPCQVEGLKISSLFSSDIMNPDGGLELVSGLAGLELTNTSGQYLVSARIHVTLTDGTEYLFQVQDLPDGGSVLAFSPDNALYDGSVPCASISAETEYTGGGQLMEESLSVSIDGTAVTLTNLTDQDMEPVTVICHETVDESGFFGGASYSYETEAIPAGGSVTVEAMDCMIGIPAVVRIAPVS